jgi:PAS domain S-box-containing protein
MPRPLNAAEYRLIVEHAPVMIWRAGLDAKCNYFNEPWLEFTGRTLAQELGDGWVDGVHPDDVDRCVAHYLDHFHRRATFEMEYRLRRHDGEYRLIFDRGVPYNDDAGAFAGFIGSCVDVEDQRRAQDERLRRDAEQIARARDFEKWILAIVSHDIRDPLNTIQLAAHVLRQSPETSGIARGQAEVLARGVNRIQHIVADLLDYSRERDGTGIQLHPRPTDLRPVCQQIVHELEAIAQDRRFTLECQVDGRGAWDEQRVMQAISNLASNAVAHGTPGSPVCLRLTGDEQRVAVEVHNEGAIPTELLPRIFEPFQTSRHHGGRGDGLGLGLFIAKAIAEAHGGTLAVDSEGESTTFRLTLPRTPAGAHETA